MAFYGEIKNMDDLCGIIEGIGFLPFFANSIDGFSVEECVTPDLWYFSSDGSWKAWEWKGPVIRATGCAYGKFFKNKAGFISKKWYPDFANYRRDGYGLDARYDDGLARRSDMEAYEVLEKERSLLSFELKKLGGFCGKDGKKGFEGIITRLQMQGYVITEDFEYRRDKKGNVYGWGVARYTVPEVFFGKKFSDKVYQREPEESLERIVKHLKKKLNEPESEIMKLIR